MTRPDLLDTPPEDGGPPLDDPDTADLGDGMIASWSEEYGFTTLRLETDLDNLPLTRRQLDELRRFADRHWPAPHDDRQAALPVAAPGLEPATNHHTTVADLRRSLMRQHEAYEGQANVYTARVLEAPKGQPETPESAAVLAAWLGHSMASHYAYALAAVLGIAGERYGDDAARDLAFEVDEILANGDFDGANADVAEPAPATVARAVLGETDGGEGR